MKEIPNDVMKYECTCPHHTNPALQHCDQREYVPCCTQCRECKKNIKFGEMKRHMQKEHNIILPSVSRDTLDRFEKALKEFEAAVKKTRIIQ